MNTPEISLISPIYNAESTIRRMIDSVIQQSFTDWELILVDDGSTDETPKILDEYSHKDKRITVYHKENGGVAEARQFGLEVSKGNYLIHIDADDWVDTDFLESLYKVSTQEKSEIVICDFQEEGIGLPSRVRSQIISGSSGENILFDIFSGRIYGALWNKLIKRAIIEETGAHFKKEINYSEDVFFLAQVLLKKDCKVSVINKPLYHYTISQKSLTHNFTEKSFNSLCRYYDSLNTILPKREPFVSFLETLPMGRFTAGFLYKIFPESVIPNEFQKVKKIAYQTKSLRWKIGYLAIELRMYKLARILLKL